MPVSRQSYANFQWKRKRAQQRSDQRLAATVTAHGPRVRPTGVQLILEAVVMAAVQKMRIWDTAAAPVQVIMTMEEVRALVTDGA